LLGDVRLPLSRWLDTQTAVLLLIFILFYFFRLASFTLSIDDEFGAVRSSPDVWLIQGRWSLYLLERFVVARQVLPFFPFVAFGACLALSYRVLLSAFGVERLSKIDFLTFALYAGYPLWIFPLSFFSNTMAFGLGELFAMGAVYNVGAVLSLRDTATPVRRTFLPTMRAALLGALAIGMYQSFVFVVASVSLAFVVVAALREDSGWKAALARSAWVGGCVVLGIVVYEALQLTLLAATHLGGERYVTHFLDWNALRGDPLHVMWIVVVRGLQTYGGSADVFGTTLASFAVVVALGFLSIVFWPGRSWRSRLLAALLAAFLAGLPFVLHVFAGGNLPARTLVAVPAVMWLLGRLGTASPRRALAVASICAITVAAVQSMYALNLLQTANEFVRKHDEALAVAVYERIVAVAPTAASGPAATVDIYGEQAFDSVYPRPTPATMGYSFFEWDGGNVYRIIAYMHLLGYPQFTVANERQRRQDDTVFRDMPSWPAAGSVRTFDGVILIKLGPDPSLR
jgi:hypothetical protein